MHKWIITVLILMLMLPAGAYAASGVEDLWVTGAAGETAAMNEAALSPSGDAVRWWYSSRSRKYYLFLPACADLSTMKIWFNADQESIMIGDTPVKSGDSAAFLTPGTDLIVEAGSKNYTLSVMQSANIPAMFITTESGSVKHIHSSKRNAETGSLVMLNADGSFEYNGLLSQVKGRGNSTFAHPKKPYQIKLEDSKNLCGMGKAKTWVLLANYDDNSLLRNTIAFAIAQAVGLEYTSKSQAVDLYINNDYMGSYLLCEKVEIHENRVAITDLEKATEKVNENPLEEYPAFTASKKNQGSSKGTNIPNNPEDITGGYLLELEKPHRYTPEISGFKTIKGLPVVIKEPEYSSREQVAYVKDMIQSFENAIFSKDGIDKDSGKHFTELVDLDSLVKKYILEEIGKNFDANRSSFYLYKPVDAQSIKFFAGPVWDYDIAFGNFAKEKLVAPTLPDGFYANNDKGTGFYWFPALYKQPEFYEQAVAIYHQAFVPAVNVLLGLKKDPDGDILSIDEYANEVEASAAMNFTRWKVFNSENRPVQTGKDYPENISYLKSFLEKRMAFLSANWPKP